MKRWLARSAVPAYLLLCLLAGGSRQGIWANAALQLVAIILLASAIVVPRPERPSTAVRQLLALTIASVVLVLFQLVPLPPELWTALPGRDEVRSGFDLLGYELPWLPLSLAPSDTLETSYTLLPPLAVIVLIVRSRAGEERWIAAAVVAGALASVVLGAVQVAGGGRGSWAYLYEFTNSGAVGFFANRNHMATLLLAGIPFAGALFASSRRRPWSQSKAFAVIAFGASSFVLMILGLLLNSSLAALALAIPVIAASALILPMGWRLRRLILPLAAIGLIFALVALGSSSVGTELASAPDLGSLYSRGSIWRTTIAMIGETFPAGTGLGTFSQVYVLQEDPASVGTVFINHAHNDYLELVLETGLPGLVLISLFLAWWARQVVRVWRSPLSTQFAKAATIASAAILAHSIVDYPLRTAAISALFAACVGIIAQEQSKRRGDEPRHVTIA